MERYSKKFNNNQQILKEDKSYKLLHDEGYFNKIYPHIKEINKIIGWDIDLARSVCIQLLQDVNDHDMSKKLDQLFSRDLE